MGMNNNASNFPLCVELENKLIAEVSRTHDHGEYNGYIQVTPEEAILLLRLVREEKEEERQRA